MSRPDPDVRLASMLDRRASKPVRPRIGDLSERQQRIVREVRRCWYQRGYPPTMEELAVAVGLASRSTVYDHVGKLERMGWLRREWGKARTLRVVEREAA